MSHRSVPRALQRSAQRRRMTALASSAVLVGGLIASLQPATATATASDRDAKSEGPTAMAGYSADSAAKQRAREQRLQRLVDPDSAAEMSEAMSSRPGLVGTEGAAERLEYSLDKLSEWGLEPEVESYDVYASVPRDISVTMTAPQRRELQVKEEPYPWHENFDEVVVGYNAYSPPGEVSADVVYVNYGLPEDYAKLEELGVDVEDKIVLARYGQSFRGVKSQVAQENGAAGVILYSDPEDDGFGRGEVYPDGPWRPPQSIQRGSVQFIFKYPGDPLTPGEPSTPGTQRLDPDEAENVPEVPTTPISYGQAKHLLTNLDGPAAPDEWQGGLDFDYQVGPGSTAANLDLDIDYEQLPVRNAIVEIPGSEHPDQKIVLGAHYDSWTYGTKDDVSGWTTLMEAGRALAELRADGWQPDRTIVLAGWDGEEYGLLGATEWAEQHRAELTEGAVAYVNMDGAGGGLNFDASAVPALDDLLVDVARQVDDPDHGTVYANWQDAAEETHPEPGRLGSGSDYTAFLDHLGIASADFGMSTPGGEYHSAYDDLHTMRNYLDPGYTHHAVAAAYAGTLAMRLAEADTLPLRYSDYAAEVLGYLRDLDEQQSGEEEQVVDLEPAYEAAREWQSAAIDLQGAAQQATRPGAAGATGKDGKDGKGSKGSKHGTDGKRSYDSDRAEERYAEINEALLAQERALIQEEGLPRRPWFRHMVYAPGFYTGYAVQPLSAIDDAIADGDAATAQRYRDLLVESLQGATQAAAAAAR